MKLASGLIWRYADLKVQDGRMMIGRAQEIGYMFNDRQVTPVALSIGLPIANPHGPPIAAMTGCRLVS